jgi:class 3 adenylate cyclase
MVEALAAHDETLRGVVEEHSGRLFKHTGDGIRAVFDSAQDAVAAAVAAQRLLKLPVRMGIHSGQAFDRGLDFVGPALNRAARLMDAGHGGQILLH